MVFLKPSNSRHLFSLYNNKEGAPSFPRTGEAIHGKHLPDPQLGLRFFITILMIIRNYRIMLKRRGQKVRWAKKPMEATGWFSL